MIREYPARLSYSGVRARAKKVDTGDLLCGSAPVGKCNLFRFARAVPVVPRAAVRGAKKRGWSDTTKAAYHLAPTRSYVHNIKRVRRRGSRRRQLTPRPPAFFPFFFFYDFVPYILYDVYDSYYARCAAVVMVVVAAVAMVVQSPRAALIANTVIRQPSFRPAGWKW